jgi:hypothetical protein
MPDFSNLVANVTNADLSAATGPKQLFVMLVLLFIFLYGMSIGKTRALLSLLSVYVALTLTNLFPFFTQVTDAAPENFEPYLLKAGLFLLLFVGVFVLLHKSSLKRLGMGELAMWKVFVISAIQIGFIGAVIASFIPEQTAMEKLPFIYPFIGSNLALFMWSIISLAILPLMKHRRD